MIEPVLSDDALLADIREVRGSTRTLHIWWLGQSGFLVKHRRTYVLFDPYLSDSLTAKYAGTEKPHVRMSRRVIDPGRLSFVDYITSTHAHTDHLDPVTLRAIHDGPPSEFYDDVEMWDNRWITLIHPVGNSAVVAERTRGCSNYILEAIDVWGGLRQLQGLEIAAVPAAHPDRATDDGGHCLYLGYVVQFGPFTVYHSGDTLLYDGMIEDLSPWHGKIDVAILPINGKVNNMDGADAARLAKAIGARLVIPCHYHLFEFNTAEPSEKFVPECERLGQPYRVLRLGERLTLEAPAP